MTRRLKTVLIVAGVTLLTVFSTVTALASSYWERAT